MYQTVTLKTTPEVKAIVNAAFPSYKKHKASISTFYEGFNINSYWDGGSKGEYAIVDMVTMQRKALPSRSHPYFDIAAKGLANQSNDIVETDHVGNVKLKILPEGYALVQAGFFCGKPATACVYVNPSNLAKLITA